MGVVRGGNWVVRVGVGVVCGWCGVGAGSFGVAEGIIFG